MVFMNNVFPVPKSCVPVAEFSIKLQALEPPNGSVVAAVKEPLALSYAHVEIRLLELEPMPKQKFQWTIGCFP